MKKLLTIAALMLAASSASASGWRTRDRAGFSHVDASFAAATEQILATNVPGNVASSEVSIVGLGPILHANLWLAGGEWPIDVAYTTSGDALPIEVFVRWRVASGVWNYDGYLLPGLGTAFYRIPLPTMVLSTDELEIVVNNPRATKTANVRIRGNVTSGPGDPEFILQQISSVITPAGSAVVNRGYGTYCFRRPPGAVQIRSYLFAVDGTAGQSLVTGFYRPSYNQDGSFWGGLTTVTAATASRTTLTGDLSCSIGIFTGTYTNAATASLRLSLALGPYAP